MKKLGLLIALSVVSQVHAKKWNSSNNPNYFNPMMKNGVVTQFDRLPLSAHLTDDRLGWSDSFWPSNLGGIAYRWNHPEPLPFNYKFHTKDELLKMSHDEISQLSPAELYDIAMGDYKYSLSKKVLRKYSPKDLWWEGICHGWALAASNYPEPDKIDLTNKDGIHVPFGSSDVKALLSMHDAFNSKGFYVRVGDRCSVVGKVDGEAFPEDGLVFFPPKKLAEKSECEDVNAGTFHIILTSMIGLEDKGFVADVDRFNDVWNQPVTGYESTIVEEVSLNNEDIKNKIYKKVRIKTVMTYGDELEFYDWKSGEIKGTVSKDPVTGTINQMFNTRTYDYILELDIRRNIVGGEWISESRPDMLWKKMKDKEFNDSRLPLSGLKYIYRPVQR